MAIIQFLKSNEIDNTYSHQIDFENLQAQNTFWKSQLLSEFETNLSTSRLLANGLNVYVGKPYARFIGVNYCRIYQDGRYWYYFITNKQYVNENNTQLFLELDVFQTFMFEYEITESFIDREHQDRFTSDLKPIFNTINENLSYGNDYITTANDVDITSIYDSINVDFYYMYVYATTKLTTTDSRTIDENIPTGFYCYVIPFTRTGYQVRINIGGEEKIIKQFSEINTDFLSNTSIQQIVVSKIPPCQITNITKNVDTSSSPGITYYLINSTSFNTTFASVEDGLMLIKLRQGLEGFHKIKDVELIINPNININNLKSIDNEPKLLTHPYNFTKYYLGQNELLVKNEDIEDSKLYCFMSLSDEGTSGIYLQDYLQGSSQAIDNTQLITNLSPAYINLISDPWKNYLLNNKAQRAAGFMNTGIQTALNLGLGIATGGASFIFGGINQIAGSLGSVTQTLAKEIDIRSQPYDIKQFAGDTSIQKIANDLGVKEIKYQIKDKYKEIIFKYLYVYGYKANEFKVPNLKSRYYFNFIKTIGVNIKSDLDNEYIAKLSEIYNNGITIWHYRDANTWRGMYNYEYENAEMSLI